MDEKLTSAPYWGASNQKPRREPPGATISWAVGPRARSAGRARHEDAIMKNQLLAYHGKPEIKQEYLNRVRAHRVADELIQHYGYWIGGKGCAVGCTIHGSDYKAYERELGIPQIIARVEDGLFERLPHELAQTWPERFLEAIPLGADLDLVSSRFLHWLLLDKEEGVIRFAKTANRKSAISRVGKLYARRLSGSEPRQSDWKKAIADAAYAYAADAAYAYAAAAADAAYAAYAASARKNVTVRQSDKLLELLRNAP